MLQIIKSALITMLSFALISVFGVLLLSMVVDGCYPWDPSCQRQIMIFSAASLMMSVFVLGIAFLLTWYAKTYLSNVSISSGKAVLIGLTTAVVSLLLLFSGWAGARASIYLLFAAQAVLTIVLLKKKQRE